VNSTEANKNTNSSTTLTDKADKANATQGTDDVAAKNGTSATNEDNSETNNVHEDNFDILFGDDDDDDFDENYEIPDFLLSSKFIKYKPQLTL